MTHPLLTPRYMVEADYPNSPFRVGDVLTVDGGMLISNNYQELYVGCAHDDAFHVDIYPRCFRKMHWSEGRELNEMPRYLRFIHNREYVLQVDMYIAGKVSFVGKQGTNKIEWYTPATEAEYLEYLKSKEK